MSKEKKKNYTIDKKDEIVYYIINEYDKNYRKIFNVSEFLDKDALREIIDEFDLKVNKRKKIFTIDTKQIRILKNIHSQYFYNDINAKISTLAIVITIATLLPDLLISIFKSFGSIEGWNFYNHVIFEAISRLFVLWLILKCIKDVFKDKK